MRLVKAAEAVRPVGEHIVRDLADLRIAAAQEILNADLALCAAHHHYAV